MDDEVAVLGVFAARHMESSRPSCFLSMGQGVRRRREGAEHAEHAFRWQSMIPMMRPV
jgi:hypothetical protein